MNALRFAGWGLREAAGRNLYLLATTTVAVAAWLGLAALAAPFLPATSHNDLNHVVIVSALARQELPLRFVDRIAQLDGVNHVAYAANSLMVRCKEGVMPPSIQAFGGDPEAIRRIYNLWPVADPGLEALQERWFEEPMGVLAGAQTARDCDWRTGMAVAPAELFSGEPVDLRITGILPERENPILNIISFAHHEYLARRSEAMGQPINLVSIEVFPQAGLPRDLLAARIESALAGEFPPVEVRTGSHLDAALGRYGQLQYLLGFVAGAVLLCTALVAISSLAYLAAQRRRQWAMLQTLGFGKPVLFTGFVLEWLVVAALAAALGTAIALLVLDRLPATLTLLWGGLAVPAWAWWQLPLWLALVLALALLLPARTLAQLRPTDTRAL